MENMKIFLIIAFGLFISSFSLTADRVNEDQPEKGIWDLQARKIWDVSKCGKQSMARPNIGGVLADGSVCVFDYKHKANYLLDANGKFLVKFGKKGEGPGEVKSQSSVFVAGNKIILGEYGRLHYFSNDGSYLKTVLLKRDLGFPKIMVNENEYISRGANINEFYRINLLDESKSVLGDLAKYEQPKIASGGFRISIVIPPLTPTVVCALDGENKRLFYGENDKYQIHVMDLQENRINRFSVKRNKQVLTKKMKRKINKEMPIPKTVWKRLPKNLTFFHKIQGIDSLVLVYITQFEEYFKTQHIDIFSSEGTYLYRTSFSPEPGEEIYSNFQYKMIINKGYLYAAIQGKNGDMKVIKYQIKLPR